MAILRGWLYLTFVAIASLPLIHQTFRYSNRVRRPLIALPYTPPPKVNDGRIHWTDRPIHFPLTNLTSLPAEPQRKLPPIQHEFGTESQPEKQLRKERQQQIRDFFQRCWKSYKAHAWM